MRFLLLLLPFSTLAAEPFPAPINSEKVPGEPLPPAEAAASLRVPDGFHVSVFAAEPEVRNPIACSWDTTGRLWIAENYTFDKLPGKQLDTRHRDRVLIFADPDNDGKADKPIVFTDQLSNLTSIEWATDGLWLMCPPRLLFIPDRNRDDLPDGPAETILDGFTVPPANHHNFANGLRWGPDGWLYGRCGASAPGEVGLPGAPDDHRVPLRGAIWRYHPQRQIFEALNSGTTNPWGHDWDEHGELFFINTVNGHLWHSITGARYIRPHTIDPNPYSYEHLDMHADHWHFDTKGDWTKSRDGAANQFGGGHAHVGMMIYQGQNWPEQYRGHLFTLNFHGKRANQEILERQGSGYVAKHGEDLLLSGDPFFRGIDLTTGPDGAVYLLDWSDTGECHEDTGVHRTSGRIFKITHGQQIPPLATQEDLELEEVTHGQSMGGWHSRLGRQELLTRKDRLQSVTYLNKLLAPSNPASQRLNALWTLHQLNTLSTDDLTALLADQDEHLRVWAIRLLIDTLPLDNIFGHRHDAPESTKLAESLLPHLTALAKNDSSALVRLTLASTLQRLPYQLRATLAKPLAAHPEDADDHNLPLMIWYGINPLATDHPNQLADIATTCRLPKVRRFIARRLAEDIAARPEPLNLLLQTNTTAPPEAKADLLRGMIEAFAAAHKIAEPPAWKSFAETNPELEEDIRSLNVLFGDGRALSEVRALALSGNNPLDLRKSALRTLIKQKPDDLRKLCEDLLDTRFLNTVALQGLRQFDDPAIADRILDRFGAFHPSEYQEVLETLVARPTFARVLLQRIAAGKFPRQHLTPYHARQIQAFNNDELTALLATTWGSLNDSPAEKTAFITQLKQDLSPAALAAADLSAGRGTFEAACATCHTLYGQGGKIGPDLTGGGRHDLHYLLENIITPSAVVTADFQLTVLKLQDGRTLTGVIRSRNKQKITLQTLTAEETIPAAEITENTKLPASLMPDGLLEALPPNQRRNLLAYLMSPTQVAPRPEP